MLTDTMLVLVRIAEEEYVKETAVTISHIHVVSIPVTDPERAKSFYVDKLGFDVRSDNPMGPDQRWVEVAPKGAQTGLTLVTWFPTMQPGSVKGLVLKTPDIRTTYEDSGLAVWASPVRCRMSSGASTPSSMTRT